MAETGPERAAAWDRRYAAGDPSGLFGAAPCIGLRMLWARPDFSPETALFPADGDGRNGSWAAGRGARVTAVDLSAEATRRALGRDRAAGVTVERIVADLAGWRPDPGRRWDAVLIYHLHAPEALRADLIRRAVGWLNPGGWLAVEGFALAQAAGEIGPDDPDRLYDLDALRGWSAGLRPIEAMAGRACLDEGPRHSGEAEIVRFLARAPGPG